jgi:hypothetical protein
MTKTTVAAKVHQSLHRSRYLSTKVSLYFLATLDNLSDLINLLLCEVIGSN